MASQTSINNKVPNSNFSVNGNIDSQGGILFDVGDDILNYYEAGNWTPVLSFGGGSTGIGYSSREGIYVRIGNLIQLTFSLLLSNKGTSTGTAGITGFPFIAQNVVDFWMGRFTNYSPPASTNYLSFMLHDQEIKIVNFANGATSSQFTDAQFNNNTVIQASMLFRGD